MNTVRTLAIAGFLSLAGFSAAQAGHAGPVRWVQLSMTAPKGVEAALPAGQKTATDVLHVSVSLPYRDPAGMQSYVDAVSNPRSSNYRQFLTPKQIGARFGLAEGAVSKVRDYLAVHGMSVKLVSDNRLAILADATVAQAQAAFSTVIEDFRPITGGSISAIKRFSFTTPPSVPAEIANAVAYIGGLESFTQPKHRDQLFPNQLRTLYGIAPGYGNSFQGQGRTIGITNFVGYRLSNAELEYTTFGLPIPNNKFGSNIVIVPVNGQKGSVAPEDAEGDIDMQCVLAMAPQCKLIIYDDADDSDLISTLTKEANDNQADLITESYGWVSSDLNFYIAAHNQHLAMSAEGITYLCASGDAGTDTLDPKSGEFSPYPDDDPEVLSIGGTSVITDTLGDRTHETGWGGSGGGWVARPEAFNVRPAYQQGNGMPAGIPYRLVPDIAFDSDPDTGYEIFVGGEMQGWGGTSCASPTCAGGLAAAEQQIIAGGGLPVGREGHQRYGRIQDLLYSYGGASTVFFDVTSGSNGTLPNGATSTAGPGWNTVTGWGPLVFSGFVNAELGSTVRSSVSVKPSEILGGASASGTITLGVAATSSGTTVVLSSSTKDVTVPSSVIVPSGEISTTFKVSTKVTATTVAATISATVNGVTVRTSVAIDPPTVSSLTASPSSVSGGFTATGTVTLNGTAPAAGIVIDLSSNTSSAVPPEAIRIEGGKTSATFKIATRAVSKASSAILTAKKGDASSSSTITIQPPLVAGVTVSPKQVIGGRNNIVGTVKLSGPAPRGGLVISLFGPYPTLVGKIPSTITIAEGQTGGAFVVRTSQVTQTTPASVETLLNGAYERATFTVLPPALVAVTINPTTIRGNSGDSVTGTVTIGSIASKQGLQVYLSSSNSAATVLASVTIPPGKSSVKFQIAHGQVSAETAVTITASTDATSKSAKLTLAP